MSYLQAIILGIVQGLTEFLPVSSSGHLVIVQELMGVKELGATFELLVHLGTLCSVLIYFRKRILAIALSPLKKDAVKERWTILYLFIATLPAVVAALLFKDQIEEAFDSPLVACSMLIVTGFLLLLPKWIPHKEGQLKSRSALAMGCGQALALMPGISRSGTTIISGRLSGVQASQAAEFSFLMAIPAILGAAVFKLKDISEMARQEGNLGPFLTGAVVSFFFGLAAVYIVLASIRRGKFQHFSYYCIAVGIGGLLFFTFRAS